MEEDNLLMLANVAFWLSEKEEKLVEHINKKKKKRNFTALTIGESFTYTSSSSLGSPSAENPPKKSKLVLSLSDQNGHKERFVLGNNNHHKNNTDFWLTGVTKKKRTFIRRRCSIRALTLFQQTPPRDTVAELKDRIRAAGGEELQLAVEKPLTVTDLSSNHGRLSMPNGSLKSTFLRDDEASWARDPPGLAVSVVDESFRVYNLRLRQWPMGSTYVFNLNGDWNSVAAGNSLSPGDVVQLWSFRRLSRLCFAFVKLRGD